LEDVVKEAGLGHAGAQFIFGVCYANGEAIRNFTSEKRTDAGESVDMSDYFRLTSD
jgi:hypothetical protein